MNSSKTTAEAGVLDEEKLIERACGGDIAAYESLVETYQDLAFRTAYVVTREASAAEDATQEAFLRAYRALPRFHAGSPFKPWLLRIVANEARRRQASSARQTRIATHLIGEFRVPVGRSVESDVLASELREQLHQAVERLSESDQLVIAYRFVLGLSEREMAVAMNCRPGTIKSRLSRALSRLRTLLATREPELLRIGLIDA